MGFGRTNYDNAIKLREAEFNSNYTKYCDCNQSTKKWTADIVLAGGSGVNTGPLISAIIHYNNPCGSSKNANFRFTYSDNGTPRTRNFSKSIPIGSGQLTENYDTGSSYRTNTSAICVTCSGSC